jgi:hypothetical protein
MCPRPIRAAAHSRPRVLVEIRCLRPSLRLPQKAATIPPPTN